ncbi:type I-E CRISPR-associated protein Cse2/CasB [Thermus filiformis]|uniref:CRISPR-associated protein Cse2 n=1 Tax=Thermus filiformis TaxID=276 RepID=A0A0A2WV96_THEFI|nr:type I-E CRISPR-associated protein Cse2/CasB [Thermus filiformis]KGQ22210.2 CRISPR-associated protein Cse2 [Thermus filiformis]
MKGEEFIRRLEDLKAKKAWTRARAVLRRSLAFPPGAYPPAMPYVEPYVGKAEGWRREAYYLVAALYALKDGAHRPDRTLARALREEGRGRDSASLERRFLALLDADRDQVASRLRRAVALVEGGLDFGRLLDDLRFWFDPNRRVQARWAREFYGLEAEADLSEEKQEEVEG